MVMDKKEFEELLNKSTAGLERRLEKSLKKVIKEEIEELVSARLSDINNKLKEIEKSQSFLANQYETFRNQVGFLMAENTKIKEENVQLVARIRNLEKGDKQRAKAVDDLEQYGRRNMVEVSGIPRRAKENCEELVLELASKIGVELKAENIEACHRISPKQDAPIIVKVVSRKDASSLLSKTAKSNARRISIADLVFEVPATLSQNPTTNVSSGKVFVNESLTSRNKNLLRVAKTKKRELDYKFLWLRNGTIYMRRNENAPVKKIAFLDDLEKLDEE